LATLSAEESKLEKLTAQYKTAVERATAPITSKYVRELERLKRDAMRNGDLEESNKIQLEIAKFLKVEKPSPNSIVGEWQVMIRGSEGRSCEIDRRGRVTWGDESPKHKDAIFVLLDKKKKTYAMRGRGYDYRYVLIEGGKILKGGNHSFVRREN